MTDGSQPVDGKEDEGRMPLRLATGDVSDPDPAPLRINGDWSIGNAGELHEILSGYAARGGVLAINFGDVRSCDTTTLQLIYSLCRTRAQWGQPCRITAVSPAIENVATSLGLSVAELIDVPAGTARSAPSPMEEEDRAV